MVAIISALPPPPPLPLVDRFFAAPDLDADVLAAVVRRPLLVLLPSFLDFLEFAADVENSLSASVSLLAADDDRFFAAVAVLRLVADESVASWPLEEDVLLGPRVVAPLFFPPLFLLEDRVTRMAAAPSPTPAAAAAVRAEADDVSGSF